MFLVLLSASSVTSLLLIYVCKSVFVWTPICVGQPHALKLCGVGPSHHNNLAPVWNWNRNKAINKSRLNNNQRMQLDFQAAAMPCSIFFCLHHSFRFSLTHTSCLTWIVFSLHSLIKSSFDTTPELQHPLPPFKRVMCVARIKRPFMIGLKPLRISLAFTWPTDNAKIQVPGVNRPL